MHNFLSLQILPHMGKESNCLNQKYKAMGKESYFLFPPKCTVVPPHKSSTWGRNQTFLPLQCKAIFLCELFPTWGRVKLSSAKMLRYHSQQILPILCLGEGFFPIMQNFYKSFPTYIYFFSFLFIFHFIFIHFFFTSFYYFFFLTV